MIYSKEPQSKILKIRVSDEEEQVLEKIQANLKKLHNIETQINLFKKQLPQSLSRIHKDKYQQITNQYN